VFRIKYYIQLLYCCVSAFLNFPAVSTSARVEQQPLYIFTGARPEYPYPYPIYFDELPKTFTGYCLTSHKKGGTDLKFSKKG